MTCGHSAQAWSGANVNTCTLATGHDGEHADGTGVTWFDYATMKDLPSQLQERPRNSRIVHHIEDGPGVTVTTMWFEEYGKKLLPLNATALSRLLIEREAARPVVNAAKQFCDHEPLSARKQPGHRVGLHRAVAKYRERIG